MKQLVEFLGDLEDILSVGNGTQDAGYVMTIICQQNIQSHMCIQWKCELLATLPYCTPHHVHSAQGCKMLQECHQKLESTR